MGYYRIQHPQIQGKLLKMKWVALFSQTGSELLQVCQALNRVPDIVIHNNPLGFVNDILQNYLTERGTAIVLCESKPNTQFYLDIIPSDSIVTLHGWLRIIPPQVCSERVIFNGHPGLIIKYPELKGKDPQAKAFDLGLSESGCVIHRVTAEVDAGEILLHRTVSLIGLSLDEVYNVLHDTSVSLWLEFFNCEHFN